MSKISESYNNFCLDLYKAVVESDKNVFFSPYSIVAALSMCTAGAKNNTEKQLKEVLKYAHLSNDEIHGENQLLHQYLNGLSNNVSLNVANKIYPHHSYPIKQEFIDLLKKHYNSDVEGLNFSNANESAKVINDWVAEQTKNKITDLVPVSVINELTKLILVNAIYFKGNWDIKFNKDLTVTELFYLPNRTEKDCEMMGVRGKKFDFLYEPVGIKATACRLPYSGNNIAMTLLLPHDDQHISDIENILTGDILKAILSFENKTQLNLFVPKFKFEQQFELNKVVSNLGAPDAFDENKADFSGIKNLNDGLHISNIIHKAVVEVNEEGTEAAAATAVVMELKCARRFPLEFRCNRPFLFFIHDTQHHTVLFMGRHYTP